MRRSAVRLASFDGSTFSKGASIVRIFAWFVVNQLLVRPSWNPFMGFRITLLRLFGARIGSGLVLKNGVNVKFPWKLTVGCDCWIGEGCWIDNLDEVEIGDNVCISQGAMLLTGNHDYSVASMPYRNAKITVRDGAWLGARAVVCPGVQVGVDAVLTVGSVATHDLAESTIYQGNPAREVRARNVEK